MSTLVTTALRHNASASNNMVLDSSGNVGVGTTSPAGRLHIQRTDSGDTLHLAGNSAFVGMANRTNYANSTTYSGVYYDARNESNAAVANMLADVATDGSSAWSWSTQPAGTRTDRRVERMRISGSGIVTMPYQSALRLDGNNGTGIDFAGSTQLLVSTYYSSNYSRGDLSWNSTTGRVTATTAGVYCIMYQVYVQTTSFSNGRLLLRKNGTSVQLMQTGLSADGTYDLNSIISLAANDYIDMMVDGFDTMRMYMGTTHTDFHMFLLG